MRAQATWPNNRDKLTEADIIEIKKLRKLGLKVADIGAYYGVTHACIMYHTGKVTPPVISRDKWLKVADYLLEEAA